jgi:hypothetical protein
MSIHPPQVGHLMKCLASLAGPPPTLADDLAAPIKLS